MPNFRTLPALLPVVTLGVVFLARTLSAHILTDPRCGKAMQLLVAEYQRATVRVQLENPVYVWAINHGADANAFHRFAVQDLEGRVIELLSIPPELRGDAMQMASLEFNLPQEGLQSVLDYYAAIVFEEPRLSSSPSSFWPRVENLSRALRIVEPQVNSPESRYLFYLMQLTRKSVPQIAEELNFSEARVRQELSHLKLSILNRFESSGRLAQARARYDNGETVETVARDLGFGVEALRFILHYERELNRGSKWSDAELSLLRHLHARGDNHAQIARALNALTRFTPADPLYRTEGAVAAKIDGLNLNVERVRKYPATISLPNYGEVKRNGHLTPAAQEYIRNHYLDSLDSVAHVLGVRPESLADFIRRHDLVFMNLPAPRVPGTPPVAEQPRPPASGDSGPKTSGPDRAALHGASAAERKAQARELLEAQEKRRQAQTEDEKAPPLILRGLKSDQSLHEVPIEQLDGLLKDASDQLGGFSQLNSKPSKVARFAAPDSTTSFAFETLLRAWAVKQWRLEHPGEVPLMVSEIFKPELGGKTPFTWLNQWKESHGAKKTLPENTVILSGLKEGTELSSLSAPELSALVKEAADQMGGVSKLGNNVPTNSRPLAAAGSTDSFQFGTLLRHWAIKQWQLENPGRPALKATEIFKAEHGGKTASEWLKQWKEEQSDETVLPETVLVLRGLKKGIELSTLSAEELSALLKEAAEQMGGVSKLNSGKATLARQLAAKDSTEPFSFYTLMTAWAAKQWQLEHPGRPALKGKEVYATELGGDTSGKWIEKWKQSQGEKKVLPENTLVLRGLKAGTGLSKLSAPELSALLKEAADQMGGVSAVTLNTPLLHRRLAAPDSTESFTFETLLRAWAINQWQLENAGKPALRTTEIFKADQGGKTHSEWLGQWKESQGVKKELPENTLVLPGMKKETDLYSLSAAELSALLKEAADQMGGADKLTAVPSTFSSPLAAPNSTESFTFLTLLTTWAVKQWQIENPGKPALTSKQVIKTEHGGKPRGEWLRQWKASQGQ